MRITTNTALAAVLVLGSVSTALATNHTAHHRDVYAMGRVPMGRVPLPNWSGGRQVAAPPWSFACMTDHGPSPCGEPMWVYGNYDP
jgi:hypothetical protein